MSREHQQMRVRLPPDLKDNIELQAIKNGRSMNAEIVYRLQRSLDEEQKEQEEHVDGFHTIQMTMADHRNYTPRIGDALRKIEQELRAKRQTQKN
jgi:hypothetical protein